MGSGVVFRAGPGVGTVTRAGLPLPPGEPAINPTPRQMIRDALASLAGGPVDVEVEIGVDDGEALAKRTLNGRLGIVGGLSILGTTGIVVPYSCAAWIDSIHRGIDVARAAGLTHVAGATGSASEAAVAALYGLPEVALIEMGDFVGGMLRYLRRHPVARVTIAGGVAKMTKLAQGRLDLHSKRGAVDFAALATLAGVPEIGAANATPEAFALAAARGVGLGDRVAALAWATARAALDRGDVALDVALFDREGRFVASHGG
jgi:cobalt-precorrin-5B (C1)-methyltransferase